jgi:sugar lactone lactonase YvrE
MDYKRMKLTYLMLFLSISGSAFSVEPLIFNSDNLEAITINKPALYPEGIDYNPDTDKFIVGSFRDGGVYEIDLDGNYRQLISDERLNSVLGVRVDIKRNRLLVANSDIGSSINSYAEGPKKLASLGIYDLSTGKNIDFINLGKLLPNKNHLANGMTFDSEGNIYVTDSFAPVIYKIDISGHASIFLESDRFSGMGINLNGIVYHPDGYLIAVKKGEGILFKIPLDNPQGFSVIKSDRKFIGGDGLVLVNNKKLILIANRAAGKITETVFSLDSPDDWKTTNVTNELKFGKVYLTTGVMRKDKLYVMHSNLKTLMLAPADEKNNLDKKATIQQVKY